MTNEEMNWFLRGGKRPEPAPTAPVVACQNCGGDNLADEEQCTHCGEPLEVIGKQPSQNDEKRFDPAEYLEFMRRLVASSEPATGGEDDKVCPKCGSYWPSNLEYCPTCNSVLRSCPPPGQKTYLVKVSQVKRCLWEGYVEIVANSKLEALVAAREEFGTGGLDSWDLVDSELGSEDGSDDEPVFSVEAS